MAFSARKHATGGLIYGIDYVDYPATTTKVILDRKCPTILALYQVPRYCYNEKAKKKGRERNKTKQSKLTRLLFADTGSLTHDMMCPADGQRKDDKKKANTKSTINHHDIFFMQLSRGTIVNRTKHC